MSVRLLLSGGLGNQLFQYAAAKCLALKLRVPLIVDLRFFSNAKASSSKAPWLLDFPIKAQFRNWGGELLGPHHPIRRLARRFVTEPPRRRFVERELEYNEDFFEISDGATLIGVFQSPLYFVDSWNAIRTELDISDRLVLPSHIEGEPLDSMIGVHVRRGDYVANPDFAMADPENYYSKAIALARSHGGRRLLVFSDDLEWCRRQTMFEGAFFFTSSVDLPPYHDLFTMSRVGALVMANSSYSWWAGWFANERGAAVIAPRQWIMGRTSDEMSILPKEWHQI